jgi:hypothetical protein
MVGPTIMLVFFMILLLFGLGALVTAYETPKTKDRILFVLMAVFCFSLLIVQMKVYDSNRKQEARGESIQPKVRAYETDNQGTAGVNRQRTNDAGADSTKGTSIQK